MTTIEDILTRSTIGTGGFLATLGLAEFSEIVSIAVGLATFFYMIAGIYKTLKNWGND